jgi:hypothetical protein
MDQNQILVQIKTNLDRIIAIEFPKIERAITDHDTRLRQLEISQIKLDMMGPKIDSINNHITSIDDMVDKRSKPLNEKVERLEGQIDELRAFMWKTIGAIAIISMLIPFLANKLLS